MATTSIGSSGVTFPDSSTQASSSGVAKAWVNFNGNSGSVAIRKAYNVSSITRVVAGEYTVNFTNALADANFSALVSSSSVNGGVYGKFANIVGTTTATVAPTTSQITVWSGYTTTNADETYICVAVFD